jgi:hypothetical protein
MNALSCQEAGLLLDLYAAGECDRADTRAVRAHLGTCPACRAALEQSRQLLGLLDVHFHQEAGLERLARALRTKRKAGRPPAVLPFWGRFGAVAALVLITFGLALGLTPLFGPQPWRAPRLQAVLVAPGVAEHVPAVRGKALAKDGEAISMRGTKKASIEKTLKETGHLPLPPRLGAQLVLRNPEAVPLEVRLGGPGFALVLELSGGAVERRDCPDPAFVPFPARTLTIAPGGSQRLVIERLASQVGVRVQYLYPSAAREYTLRVRLRASAGRPGRPASRRFLTVEAGPLPVVVRRIEE